MTTRARLSTIVRAMTIATVAATMSACAVAAYPEGVYDVDYPPADFIATAEPVYFEGHAAYFYDGRWFYRDGDHWAHYDREPPALTARRGQFSAAARVNYGRPSTRAAVSRGARR